MSKITERICTTDCSHYKEKTYIDYNSKWYCDIDDQDVLPFRKCRFGKKRKIKLIEKTFPEGKITLPADLSKKLIKKLLKFNKNKR